MNHCTECNFPLEDGLLACPQCGTEVSLDDGNGGTINVSGSGDDQTFDFAQPQESDESENDDSSVVSDSMVEPQAESRVAVDGQQVGTGTVSAPGVEADLQSQTLDSQGDSAWEDDDEMGQTIDAGLTELEEADDFDFDDDFPGVLSEGFPFNTGVPSNTDNTETLAASDPHDRGHSEESRDASKGKPAVGDASGTLDEFGTLDADGVEIPPELIEFVGDKLGTINAFGMPDDPQDVDVPRDPNATQVFDNEGTVGAEPGNLTVDMAAEERPTHQADPVDPGHATVVANRESSQSPKPLLPEGTDSSDSAGTVILPGSGAISTGDKTVVYESTGTGNSTVEATGASGTEGRLKRLWEGVAGSSENPMHSLQAVGLQASDSIFQRVATRRVADASVSHDVSADYQIVDKLGEGAMGIVFSARQTAVNRIVAIKTAKPNFQSNDESRRRFLYEAHITADLDHSNIVPIHELGASEEGMLFYSMKLVQGTEWSRVMRKKTREENLEIFMKVTDAMAFAHSKGVIHRDLKPENTMLGRFGEVFVTDWGTAINLDKDTTHLAKPAAKGDKFLTVEDSSNLVRGDSIVLHDGVESYDRVQIVNMDEANRNRLYLRKKLTRDYQPSRRLRVVKSINLAGTPCYMAPEMAGHQLPKIGKTSDIYILGAILYDLVTGKPPHTGDSVTQCLRAALKNELIVVGSDDPLMKIAYKAMSTEPADRYQTVEELQEAVREYRRHAESIALTERSDELLAVASEKSDYDTFSRTLFGFRDAIDLWPENTSAISGLKKARLAFGQAAYAQGNYDLALQTLDRGVPEEDVLAGQAMVAKKKVEGREASLKLLQKVVAAVVLLAIAGLSALAWVANDQKNLAVAASKLADTERQNAVLAAEEEKKAKEEETKARLDAQRSEKLKTEALREATEQRERADNSAEEAKLQAQRAEMNALLAKQEQERAEEEEKRAEEAAELAKRRSAQIQLGEYNSSLALAKSQIESFDLAAGTDNLQRLREMFNVGNVSQQASQKDVFFGNTPKIDSWGWRRIELLGNLDLPKAHVGDESNQNLNQAANGIHHTSQTQVTASAYAPQANLAVVGTKQGLVQLLQFEAGQLRTTRQVAEAGGTIHSVAISADGTEVVYSYSRGGESGVKRWDVTQATAQAVESTEKRLFQYFTYSNDGKQLVAGISGGLWIWDHNANWFSAAEPKHRISIRGELTNLQSIDPQHTLLTTRFQDKQTLIGVLDHSTATIELVEPSQTLPAPIVSAAHTLVDDRVLLGLANNLLMVGTLAPGSSKITNLVELADKHRAPVTHIVSNGVDQLITSSSSEPVAHVWRYAEDQASWEYDTYLTGTPQNIAGVGLVGGEQVLAVDAGGTSIVWNVERQKQRRQLQRNNGQQTVDYFAPLQAVVAGPSGGRALAIDNNGVVDLWSLADGQTQRVDGNRWSYIGHTPGAELVNSAVDVEQGVVVTAASLRNARKEYLSETSHDWEFCSWDVKTGAMLRRWSTPRRQMDGARTESIEQRISLVDGGRQILYASDSETRLFRLDNGRETFVRSDFGSYFAVPNPRQAGLLLLVKRSGSVRLLDMENASSWDNLAMRNFALADPSDIPLQGVWSEDGKRFFLTFSTGGLAVFHWTGSSLELQWSTRGLEGRTGVDSLDEALSVDRGRIQSHVDVDLAVSEVNDYDLLSITTRQRGPDASTKLVTLQFNKGFSQPILQRSSKESGVRWLQLVDGQNPRLAERVHDSLVVDASRIRSRLKVNNQTFVSTAGAQVLALTDGTTRVTSYGRTRLISATGNKQATALWALLEDGAIWRFTVDSDSGSWSRLDFTALGATQISLSPNAQQLLVLTQGEGILISPESGKTLGTVGAVRGFAWDPLSPARLAICRVNGSLELIADDQTNVLPQRPLMSEGAQLVQLSFFNEAWGNPEQPKRQFLLVHSEQNNQGGLQFVPIDAAPAGAVESKPEMEEIPVNSRVAVSPTENILVTGAPGGTVAVWFAAPTHDSKPRQLFDLEGHRGEQLTCLTFSSDGKTVITADTKNRLFAWMSSDPLVQALKEEH